MLVLYSNWPSKISYGLDLSAALYLWQIRRVKLNYYVFHLHLHYLTPWNRSHLYKQTVTQRSRVSPHFMEPTMSLRLSTNPTTYLYLSHASTVRALPSTTVSLKWSLSFRFPHQNPIRTYFTMYATWSVHQLFDVITCLINFIWFKFRALISEYNTSNDKCTIFWYSFITRYSETCFECLCGHLQGGINKNKITLFIWLFSIVEWLWYFCNCNCNFILVHTSLKMAT